MGEIAILYENLGRSKGGIEAWIFHAAEELQKQGHVVTVFHTMHNLPPDAVPLNVKTINIPTKDSRFNFLFFPQIFFYRKYLKNKLQNFDNVFSRSFTMAYAASSILPKNKNIYVNAAPYSFYGRLPFSYYFKEGFSFRGLIRSFVSQLSYIFAWFLERKAIEKSKNVFLSAKRMKETVDFFKIKYTEKKYLVIPGGVNVDRFFPSFLPYERDRFLHIICVCRLEEEKNVQCIIKALYLLKDKKIKLSIVGEGRFYDKLINLASELEVLGNIDFLGRRRDVEDLYRKNHLFILPSLYEGFGSVYIEAMASGLPCIAISGKKSGFKVASDEIIDHGENGFLMNNNDEKELADLILKFYNSSDLLNKLSVNARNKILKSFSWKEIVNKLLYLKD